MKLLEDLMQKHIETLLNIADKARDISRMQDEIAILSKDLEDIELEMDVREAQEESKKGKAN